MIMDLAGGQIAGPSLRKNSAYVAEESSVA
jgi:hypothetical protein